MFQHVALRVQTIIIDVKAKGDAGAELHACECLVTNKKIHFVGQYSQHTGKERARIMMMQSSIRARTRENSCNQQTLKRNFSPRLNSFILRHTFPFSGSKRKREKKHEEIYDYVFIYFASKKSFLLSHKKKLPRGEMGRWSVSRRERATRKNATLKFFIYSFRCTLFKMSLLKSAG
jgi:hypothetical protein